MNLVYVRKLNDMADIKKYQRILYKLRLIDHVIIV